MGEPTGHAEDLELLRRNWRTIRAEAERYIRHGALKCHRSMIKVSVRRIYSQAEDDDVYDACDISGQKVFYSPK